MNEKWPSRKHPRLKHYDYSLGGGYFVTICTEGRRCLLSRVVGRGLAPAEVELTEYGKIAEQQLLSLPTRYPFVEIGQYVIMPNHIHAIIVLSGQTAGASPRPTLEDIICAYKSLTTKECKAAKPVQKLFQTSFYEHVIRNRYDFEEIGRYIFENPLRWREDELFEDG